MAIITTLKILSHFFIAADKALTKPSTDDDNDDIVEPTTKDGDDDDIGNKRP